MLRVIFFVAVFCSVFTGCDVRKKDKQATGFVGKKEIKDSTTVQIIDSIYDFGKTKEGDIVQYSYRFKNTGEKPLIISEAHASCGCTIPEKPEKPVMPGETGFILVKFNSDGRPGETHKTIKVISNAKAGFPDLLLKGTVIGKDADTPK